MLYTRFRTATASMVPLRQQAEHARSSVSAFEQRLAEGSERLASSEARVASLEADLLRVGEVEARRLAALPRSSRSRPASTAAVEP